VGDRDNRRKVYLYFSPDDQTVGMSSPQGIGWQGVPDTKRCRINRQEQDLPVRTELGDRFFQRVFTMRVRDGQKTKVGTDDNKDYELWKEGEHFWNADMSWLKKTFIISNPKQGDKRKILAEPLPKPFEPDLGAKALDVSPSDAATAVTNGGRGEGMSQDGQKTETRPLRKEIIDDPRSPMNQARGGIRGSDELDPSSIAQVDKHLNQGRKEPDQVTVRSASKMGDGKLYIERTESFNEARLRWQRHEKCANSFHSGIVSNPMHSRLAHAYDIAIGWPNISKEEIDAERQAENSAFMLYLCAVADWRNDYLDNLTSIEFQGQSFAKKDFKDDLQIKTILEITVDYHKTGNLAAEIKTCPLPKLVMSETVKQEELGADDSNSPRHSPATPRNSRMSS
jgi:hypothetical protein